MNTLPGKYLLWAFAPLLAFRLWLAAALPITADEAYFIWWGKIPDWGFYDHPPMIGWWLAAQLLAGDAEWWLRLSSVLQPFVLAAAVLFMLPRIWPGLDAERRDWAALFVLLAPASVWNVLITTDTPLVYFSVFSGLAWLRARRDDDLGWYFLSGVFLAGAVLSKYFVALLGFAYLVDAVWRPSRKKLLGLLIAYACTLPALALMAWWNAGHCWPNFMFNFVNRHGNAQLSAKTPLLYVVTMAYVLTPPLLWALCQSVFARKPRWRGLPAAGDEAMRSLPVLVVVPLSLFAGLSLIKTIGMHWVLSFIPFVIILLALRLDRAVLARCGRFMAGFAALHIVVFVVVASLPLDTWQRMKWFDSIVLGVERAQIVEQLKPYEKNYTFASDGYADAVTLGYNGRRYFSVFGTASSHARHDDILTDFRALDGKNILILIKSPASESALMTEYAPYFKSVQVETFILRGVPFSMVRGDGFDYPHYRDTVLTTVRQKYYAIPAGLPQTACYFCDRYFPASTP